jgi:ATP-dependent RNA helicase RhlE
MELTDLTTFKDLNLAAPLLQVLGEEGYDTPTPIQAGAIPELMAGRDLIGIAQTGTGKTAAFLLPILHRHVLEGKKLRPAKKSGRVIVLAPTRELAAQIHDSAKAYARHMRIFMTTITGGVKQGPQVRAIASGVDLLIATPGRLLDLHEQGLLRLDASDVIVLDEADQMFDLGFLPAMKKVLAAMPRERQTVLFSATMPKAIRALTGEFLDNPAEVSVAPASKPIDRIEQSLIHSSADDKPRHLIDALKQAEGERVIVFTRTKRGADKVARHVMGHGMKAAALHGNKTQGQRKKALDEFHKGQTRVLVATDIAARGIDVDGVALVVNYELPNTPESYVHRIGRTARAGESGLAVSLCDGSERAYLRDIERLIRMDIPASGEVQPMEPTPCKQNARKQNERRKGGGNGAGGGGRGQGKPRSGGKPKVQAASSGTGSGANAGSRPRRQKRRAPANASA